MLGYIIKNFYEPLWIFIYKNTESIRRFYVETDKQGLNSLYENAEKCTRR